MKRKGLRGLVFFCLMVLLLCGLNDILCVKSPHGVDQIRYFYKQPKNKIDVLFLGSSHVHCNVDTKVLWDEYGMAAYLLTGAEQPLWNNYFLLKEALKTQKPKLVVLDMFCPSRFYDDYQYNWLDQNVDGMKLSKNKWDAVRASTDRDRMNYFLGFTKYHSRYDELTAQDFQNFIWNRPKQAKWKGFTPLYAHAELTEPDMSHVTETEEMTEKSRYYFDKIVELARKEDIQLALISAPYLLEESDQKIYNSIERIAKEEGLLFWNTNTTEHYRAMELDFAKDYADHAHLNADGSKKYAAYLGSWLTQNYEIPDRRGQKGYESWEEQEYTESDPS